MDMVPRPREVSDIEQHYLFIMNSFFKRKILIGKGEMKLLTFNPIIRKLSRL